MERRLEPIDCCRMVVRYSMTRMDDARLRERTKAMAAERGPLRAMLSLGFSQTEN
ncbi:MAG: hypothetical protein WDN46_24910 [Methylocella sp.]